MRHMRKHMMDWCPQPKMPPPTTRMRVTKSMLALALAAEVIALLVVPISYFLLLAPKSEINLMQEFPLTNDQIKAAWPNLPPAAEIVKSDFQTPFLAIDPSCATYNDVMNNTQLNIPNYKNGGLIPVAYHIWLQNGETWILVPSAYLATNNPPTLPSEQTGFLGTGLPLEYVVTAMIVIIATALALAGYFVSTNKRRVQNMVSNNL